MAKSIAPSVAPVEPVAVDPPLPFITLLDLDGKWALRVQGVTVLLEPQHELAGLPVVGLLQRVCEAVNNAVEASKA